MTADPESVSWIRLAFAFSVVFALLAALAITLKYIKTRGLTIPGLGGSPTAARLQVVESLALDMRRRLMIVRCDGDEHLILLGQDRDTVIDTRFGANRLSSTSSEKTSSRI